MYSSLEKIIRRADEQNIPFWKAVQKHDCREEGRTEEESFQKMKEMYLAMKESDFEYDPDLKSSSGLVGGEAYKIHVRRANGEMIVGEFVSAVMERALRIAESNACMKRIVAAPTAGSCGVVPAVLLSIQERNRLSDDKMTEALFVAGGIGGVIARRASLSGAEGGCQAEIGSASAMAAGALTYLLGGSGKQIINAAAIALKGLLGLSCDPVAGLVEVPCVKRNVIGSVNAVTSAEMAMAGIESKIPPDQVIDAMRSIGHMMPCELRETAKGGLAATPAAQEITQKISM
ncbi:MAG: L-serine ammonia-lyase, iron-sulfur-dependent, subunit alpha [Bulleidia sp.]